MGQLAVGTAWVQSPRGYSEHVNSILSQSTEKEPDPRKAFACLSF